MVATLDDMTEHERVEAELRKNREHLEDLLRQRTKELESARHQTMGASQAFLANMSHELRTPLSAILGMSSLLSEAQDLPAQYLEKVRVIRRSGEQLFHLINEILEIAKIEAGAVTVENVPTDLEELVSEVAEMMRVRAEEKGLQMSFEQSSSCPRFVRIDSVKLRQILINLVANAVKFTARGGVTLRLTAENSLSLRLQFEVWDTGPGIAAGAQKRIFEPGYQLGAVTGGAGLGLAIAQQYVKMMGGVISVESAPGTGSRFLVVVPAEPVEGFPVVADTRPQEPVMRLESGHSEYRILIVEDHEETRMLLHYLLTRAGFQVQVAGDGATAVEAFRSWRPHFIWMDWRLPVMDGRRATQRIREMEGGSEVKIAALTGSILPEETAAMLAAGVDDFVSKPYRREEIFECLARHLGVRYATGPPVLPKSKTGELSEESLRVLPETVRQELEDALIALDVARVTEAVRHASEANEALGAVLTEHVRHLAFTPILKALRGRGGSVQKRTI
jgi:CheY-like chemotaxis protein